MILEEYIKPFIYDDDNDVCGGGVEKAWLMTHLALQKNLVSWNLEKVIQGFVCDGYGDA